MAELDPGILKDVLNDINAFGQVVATYQAQVYNLCFRMLGNVHEAEDAAQETFWRAFQALHRYDHSRPFLTWLLSIAAHYCIDQLRQRRTPVENNQEWMDEVLPSAEPSPEIQYTHREDRQRVQQLLLCLEPHERAVLILRYWYEMSEIEMAETLSLSVSAVKSRLHRARQKIAHMWQEQQKQLDQKEKTHEAPAY